MKLSIRIFAVIGFFVGVIWIGVKLLTEIFDADQAPVVAKKSGLNGVEVSTILSTLLEESDIPWENSDTVPSLDLSTTKSLREKCTDRGIESYLIQVDSQWHWRIYERHGLLYDWKIGETVVLNNELPSITTTESLTIAILIEGTENHLIQNLLQHSAVLNFSFNPTSPFTLRNATQAASKWREIVLDVRSLPEFSIESIPYTSAVWSTDPLPLPYGVQSIQAKDVQALNLNDPMPFTSKSNFYSIDMNEYSDQQVLT